MAVTAVAGPEDGRAALVVDQVAGDWTVINRAANERIAPERQWSRTDALLVLAGLTIGISHSAQYEWVSC